MYTDQIIFDIVEVKQQKKLIVPNFSTYIIDLENFPVIKILM